MQHMNHLPSLGVVFAIALGFFSLVTLSQAADKEKVLWSFSGTQADPYGGVVFDGAGNLYGTVISGSVFQLVPGLNGTWSENVLGPVPGPTGSPTLDAAGNVYGTDAAHVFEFMPGPNGVWTEANLHAFLGGNDGSYPVGNVVFDPAGNLYGVTELGGSEGCGSNGCGTVFELSPGPNNTWTETLLYVFTDVNGAWANPYAGVVLDGAGNVYGTTYYGGAAGQGYCVSSVYGCGTVFELTPGPNGTWTESVLYEVLYDRVLCGRGAPTGQSNFRRRWQSVWDDKYLLWGGV